MGTHFEWEGVPWCIYSRSEEEEEEEEEEGESELEE
jgi:hypothetical protein